MFQKKKFIFVTIGVLILVVSLITFNFIQSRPQNVIEDRLEIKLPPSAKVINYSYYNDGGYFNAKISVDASSISSLKEQLSSQLGGIAKQKYPDINFENTCEWWDLDKENIVESYNTFFCGERKWFGYSPKSYEVWAFICKSKEGQYYLYISD